MKIQISGTVNDSIVDGPGLRFAVFTQGCPHGCKGCHNPQSHAYDGGREEDTDALIALMKKNPLLDGLTLSGGEPFEQASACSVLARAAHELGLNVWTYTGYTYEELNGSFGEDYGALLQATDVLIDGRFIQEQKSLELTFCGSRNQRLIDMKKTREQGQVVLWERPVW